MIFAARLLMYGEVDKRLGRNCSFAKPNVIDMQHHINVNKPSYELYHALKRPLKLSYNALGFSVYIFLCCNYFHMYWIVNGKQVL